MAAAEVPRQAVHSPARSAGIAAAGTARHTSPHKTGSSRQRRRKMPACRNSRIGTIGACRPQFPDHEAGCKQHGRDKACPATSPLLHPAILPRSRPHTSASAAAATITRPGISSAGPGPKLSRSRANTSAIATIPIGRLIQKTQRHPRSSADEAADGRADDQGKSGHAAEDAERPGALFLGKGGRSSIAIPSGITSAAPAPCMARAGDQRRRRRRTARKPWRRG